MFSENDLNQIREKGTTPEVIQHQLHQFQTGFPYANLIKPATIQQGILKLDHNNIEYLKQYYEQHTASMRILKFVPASGAASRMFSHLFAYREKYSGSVAEIEEYNNTPGFGSAPYFLKNLKQFAFYQTLKTLMQKDGLSLDSCIEKHDFNTVLDYVLTEKGLNYAALPKALIQFHQYDDFVRTALEEHLIEGADYCKDCNNNVFIHFTISPEHIEKLKQLLEACLPELESKLNIKFQVSYSIQKPATDTIAADEHNQPFRNSDGSLLFRPGGHGALIHNLKDLDADLVFIKNIDNIVPDRLKAETALYKKAMAGYLLKLKQQSDIYLRMLEQELPDQDANVEIISFIREAFNLHMPEDFHMMSDEAQRIYLYGLLNRPIRVCGMVKNEGEPGGGPFFVKDKNGNISLQIIESSQIDLKDAAQKNIAMSASHFNPVDLVCSMKDYKNQPFDLLNFIDEDTGFISEKSKDGKPLKALELPGLWNGAMANWNTVFVEVPIITFNPVKTVNDLLRKEHLNS
jgi:hypothetical protein